MRERRYPKLISLLGVAGLLTACAGATTPVAPPAPTTPPTSAVVATSAPVATAPAVAQPAGPPAPELASDLRWFNAEPTTLADLRGKAVLLVFWSTI